MIKEYKNNQKEIKKINDNLGKSREKNKKEIYKIRYDIYDKKITALQDERNKKINKLNDEFKKIEIKEKEKIEKLSVHISKVKRILEFIRINKKGVRELDFKAYSYYGYPREKHYLKPIDTIADDKFKKIQVFICENDKPKNKFSLCVVGMTIFNDDVLKIPYSYGLHISKEDGYFNIGLGLKDLPREQELKDFYGKNKDNILKEFLQEHKKAELEYKEVLENYINKKEWIKLYLENQLKYYENSVSRGTETDEYKKIKKELGGLK